MAVASLTIVLVAGPLMGRALSSASGSLDALRHSADDQELGPDASAPPRISATTLFAICPVDRPNHYLDDFGEPRFAGGFHRHQGVDVFARRGTPIRAPFDGTAKKSVSWAGGLGVYVYGAKGFVFNAHLTRLGKLGRVRAGDVIGYVGNTGDAQGGATHDHFEWHPGGGAAVDPYRYLNQACRGHGPTPAESVSRELKLS